MDDIERINNYIFNQGVLYSQYLDYGFPEICFGDRITDLAMYLEVLENLYDVLYKKSKGFENCLYYCPSDYIELRSEILKIIGLVKVEHYSHFKDDSEVNLFMLQNPNMVSYDRWKKYRYNFVTQYEIKVEKVDVSERCLKVSYEALKSGPQKCGVLYGALKKVEKCNLTSSVKIEESKCSQEYSVLIKDKKCDITYSAYKKALACGFDKKAIKSLYDCGGKFEVKGNKEKCYISFNGSPEIECTSKNITTIIKTLECADIY